MIKKQDISSLINEFESFKCVGCGTQICDGSIEFLTGCSQFKDWCKLNNVDYNNIKG